MKNKIFTLVFLLVVPLFVSAQFYPPESLSLSYKDGDVSLTWEEPLNGAWKGYDNNVCERLLGYGEADSYFYCAIKYDGQDLENSVGNFLTQVKFYYGSKLKEGDEHTAQFEVFIASGANAGNILVKKEVENEKPNAWNTVDLDEAIEIEANTTYYIGYKVAYLKEEEYPGGLDAGPCSVRGKSDLVSDDGSLWDSLDSEYFNCNIMIKAFISDKSGVRLLALPSSRMTDNSPKSKSKKFKGVSAPKMKSVKKDRYSSALLGYNIYRNGLKINSTPVKEKEYVDKKLPEMPYTYKVSAVYQDGESESTEEQSITATYNMVPRNVVLAEVGTGVWCEFCPGVALAVKDFDKNNDNISFLMYHIGDEQDNQDPYMNEASIARREFYGNYTNYPVTAFDGGDLHEGGNATQSIYGTLFPLYEKRNNTKSPYTLNFSLSNSEGVMTIDIDLQNVGTLFSDKVALHVAISESKIQQSWQGLSELNNIVRQVLPSPNGVKIPINKDKQTFQYEYTIPEGANLDNFNVVVFLQDLDSKEILQATQAPLITGINKVNSDLNVVLFPNPAEGVLNIKSDVLLKMITIYNVNGQKVIEKQLKGKEETIDVNNLTKGMYFVTLKDENSTFTQKVLIK
ncbi:MAG: T9SS type A sorting domain-containing protein [Hyphomicrobiales bacterium]